jgi:hypothetical protein
MFEQVALQMGVAQSYLRFVLPGFHFQGIRSSGKESEAHSKLALSSFPTAYPEVLLPGFSDPQRFGHEPCVGDCGGVPMRSGRSWEVIRALEWRMRKSENERAARLEKGEIRQSVG